MGFSNPSLLPSLEAFTASTGGLLQLARPEDEDSIHAFIESVGMQLGRNTELRSSRRPSLAHSFEEAFSHTALITAPAPVHFTAALSEARELREGQPMEAYYASDLRMGRGAAKPLRREFGRLYAGFIGALPPKSLCYTAILDENIAALNRLSKRRLPVHYNRAFEYVARTVLITPLARMLPQVRLAGIELREARDSDDAALQAFVRNRVAQLAFSNDVLETRRKRRGDQREVLVLKDGALLGYVSLFRPRQRSMHVETQSRWLRGVLTAARVMGGVDYRASIPWSYVTACVLAESLLAEPNLLPAVFQFFARARVVRSGEVVVCVHPRAEHAAFQSALGGNFIAGCPQVVKGSAVYFVEPTEADRALPSAIHLDPTEL